MSETDLETQKSPLGRKMAIELIPEKAHPTKVLARIKAGSSCIFTPISSVQFFFELCFGNAHR
jgi:hypothetical protein